MTSREALAEKLDAAVWELSHRGLTMAAKWAAEALDGLVVNAVPIPSPVLDATTKRAKTYFDAREFGRCSYHLKGIENSYGVFLRLYSKFLYGEQRRERNVPSKFSPRKNNEENPFLSDILQELTDLLESNESQDPFLLYLRGVTLRRKKQDKRAITDLIASVILYPFNWSAWQELLECTTTVSEITDLYPSLEKDIDPDLLRLFKIFVHQEYFGSEEAMARELDEAEKVFPKFHFITVQRALMQDHDSNHEAAAASFEQVIKQDPFRLEELAAYSNILFITRRTMELSNIADSAENIDMYRPETCYLVANYFGSRGEHERAIIYYQRALAARFDYPNAWTLLGHEYIELKNTNAAIQCYLTAVDLKKRDYNAWYGLGQAYEFLNEFTSSQYHYKRALALRPNDTRIWASLANCFDKLRKYNDAISAYRQALRIAVDEPQYSYRLAVLYETTGTIQQAEKYMRVTAESTEDHDPKWKGMANLWLAKQAMKERQYSEARAYALLIVNEGNFDVTVENEARAIIRDATNRLQPV